MTQRRVCFGCRLSLLLNTSGPAVISTRRGHRRSTGASRVSGDEPLVELVWSGNGIDSTRYRPQEGAEETEQQFQQQGPALGRISKANSHQAALKREDVSIRRRANTGWQLGEKKKTNHKKQKSKDQI